MQLRFHSVLVMFIVVSISSTQKVSLSNDNMIFSGFQSGFFSGTFIYFLIFLFWFPFINFLIDLFV